MVLRKTSLLGRLSGLLLCSLWLMISAATAQQNSSEAVMAKTTNTPEPPASATRTSASLSLDELADTIRRLEARVKELEAALNQTNGNGIGSAAGGATPIRDVQQELAALKAEKAEEEKKNSGFVNFFRSTTISGFVDTYYSYNFNRPTGDYQLRNFDTKHNQFGFNLAELALEKVPTTDSRLGFRMDLNYGPATEIVHSLEPGGADIFRHIQQGYLSYLAPAGKGLQIDVGKFVTQHGAEVIETKDNWNYSRSLLFALAIPYYHFGVRATYPVHDKFTLTGVLVNGWNNVVDNNDGKTYGVMATIKPTAKLTLIQNYMGGPEQANNKDDWRHLYDTTVIFNATPQISLMANYDYGRDRVNGAGVHWQGFGAYAKFQLNNWFAVTPRFEWYDDHDGFTTGLAQTIKEFTFTTEQKISGNLLTRFEYRRDFSDEPFFNRPGGLLGKSQSTLAFGFVYAFSSKGEQ